MFRTGINSLKSLCSSHSLTKIKETLEKCGKLFIHFMRSCDFGDLANISKAKGKNGPVKLYGETNTPKWSNNMQIFRTFDIINCQKTRFCRVNLVNWKETKLPEFQRIQKQKFLFDWVLTWELRLLLIIIQFGQSCFGSSCWCFVFPAMLTFCQKGKLLW